IAQNSNFTLQFRITPIDDYDSADLTQPARTGQPVLTNTFNVTNNSPPTIKPISAPKEDDNVVTLVFSVADLDGDAITLTGASFVNLQTGAQGSATAAASSPVKVGNGIAQNTNLIFQWDSRK